MLPKYRVGLLTFHSEASADRYADKSGFEVQRTCYGYLLDIAAPALLVFTLMYVFAVAFLTLSQV